MLPSEITELIKQPWSLLTYMFLRNLYILFNMLWLHFCENYLLNILMKTANQYLYSWRNIWWSYLILHLITCQHLFLIIKLLRLRGICPCFSYLFWYFTKIPNYQINIPLMDFKIKAHCVILHLISKYTQRKWRSYGSHRRCNFRYIYIKQLKIKKIQLLMI